jgi:hypothetical protein
MLFSIFIGLISIVKAHTGPHDWPQYKEDSSDIMYWAYEDDWYISPIRNVPISGTRLRLFTQKIAGQEIDLEARTISGNSNGSWAPVTNTFTLNTSDIWIQNFDLATDQIQFRTQNPGAIQSLEWDILTPIEETLPEGAIPPPMPTTLPQSLLDIGVIPRSQWGAQATNCTSPENNWYRMTIHHVASSQVYNNSVEQELQIIQSIAMGGIFCDVPYQFLIGYDGSLYQGRSLNLFSGANATTADNDGNISISFIGCYDQSSCMNSFGFYHDVTEAMLARARELIQTLSSEYGIPVDVINIKGHRDLSATACPGQGVVDRFDELLSPVAPYGGEITGQSHTDPIDVYLGESVDVWIEINNTGQRDWNPATTKLAPFPRDTDSDIAHSSWITASRVAAVSDTVLPEDTYRFEFKLTGPSLGNHIQAFTMLEEGFTWFADPPFAGSLADDAITFTLNVVEESETEPSSEPSEPANEPDSQPSNEPSEPTSEPDESPDNDNLEEGSSQGDCTDGLDNDNDVLIDCQDGGCSDKPACNDNELNNDDNDNEKKWSGCTQIRGTFSSQFVLLIFASIIFSRRKEGK